MTTAATKHLDHFEKVVAELEKCSENREDCDACARRAVCKKWFDYTGTSMESRHNGNNLRHYLMKEPRAVELISEFNTKIKEKPSRACPQCGNEKTWKHNNSYFCPKCGHTRKVV